MSVQSQRGFAWIAAFDQILRCVSLHSTVFQRKEDPRRKLGVSLLTRALG
jgi:hypothetical protein